MQKLTAIVPTGNRGISKRVAVTIVTVFVLGAILWLGAAEMSDKSSVGNQTLAQVSVEGRIQTKGMGHSDTLGVEDQIIITHADSAKVSREAQAFKQFKSEISLATQDLDSSEPVIREIVEQLTSLKACLTITYFMAKDFFTGSSEVDTIFIAEANELDRMTMNSVNIAKQAVDRLQTSLKMIEGSYTETYIMGPESIEVVIKQAEDVPAGIPAKNSSQLELTRAISFDSSLGSASALISAAALAKTATRSAWNVFGVVEKKAAKRMMAAAVPALADGPLPVGDIVTLVLESGCLAWSFHEVYEAQGMIKNDLHREFTGVMKQNSKQIRQWAMTVGNELMETAALSMPAPKVKIATTTHPGK